MSSTKKNIICLSLISVAYYNAFHNFTKEDIDLSPFFMRVFQLSVVVFPFTLAKNIRTGFTDETVAEFLTVFSTILTGLLSVALITVFTFADGETPLAIKNSDSFAMYRIIFSIAPRAASLFAIFSETKKNIDELQAAAAGKKST